MQWNDYTGGKLPPETTHVQMSDGTVAAVDALPNGLAGVIRYFGPVLAVGDPAPIPPILPKDYEAVVARASQDLLLGRLTMITHPSGWARCGLGLPAVKNPAGNTHQYRPIVVLEWINDQIAKVY